MKNFRSIRAADVMTRNVFAIPSRTTVKEAAQMLISRHYSGAPVIDATRNCVGVVSLRDIARYQQSRAEIRVNDHDFYSASRLDGTGPGDGMEIVFKYDSNETVDQIMTPLVLAVEEDAPLAEVVRLILHHHVHRVFVMDEDRHLVGIVSTIDVLGTLLEALDAPKDPGKPAEPLADRAPTTRLPKRRARS